MIDTTKPSYKSFHDSESRGLTPHPAKPASQQVF